MFLIMSYPDIRDAVWNALSDDASESQVMRALSELCAAAGERWIQCEPGSEESFAWHGARTACRALSDGTRAATFVRWHESTKHAARKARERERDEWRQAHRAMQHGVFMAEHLGDDVYIFHDSRGESETYEAFSLRAVHDGRQRWICGLRKDRSEMNATLREPIERFLKTVRS